MKKNIVYMILTTILISILFICLSTTVYSQVRSHQIASDKHELDQFESTYIKTMKSTLTQNGCQYSGITMTKVYEDNGDISYTVRIHHSKLADFSEDELATLSDDLQRGLGDLGGVTFSYEFSY